MATGRSRGAEQEWRHGDNCVLTGLSAFGPDLPKAEMISSICERLGAAEVVLAGTGRHLGRDSSAFGRIALSTGHYFVRGYDQDDCAGFVANAV